MAVMVCTKDIFSMMGVIVVVIVMTMMMTTMLIIGQPPSLAPLLFLESRNGDLNQ